MNRIDPYRNVHKAIRSMLSSAIETSGETDFTDAAAVLRLRNDLAGVIELLELHAHKEDEFIMPLVRKASPALAAEFDAQHADHEARLPRLLAALDAHDPQAADADAKAHAIVVQLSRIAGELLVHMAEEELRLNPAMWAALTDEEIEDAEHRLVASVPPDLMMRMLRWMVPALNPTERTAFIAKLPPHVQPIALELAAA